MIDLHLDSMRDVAICTKSLDHIHTTQLDSGCSTASSDVIRQAQLILASANYKPPTTSAGGTTLVPQVSNPSFIFLYFFLSILILNCLLWLSVDLSVPLDSCDCLSLPWIATDFFLKLLKQRELIGWRTCINGWPIDVIHRSSFPSGILALFIKSIIL